MNACESTQVFKFDDKWLNCQIALLVSLSRIAIALLNGSVQYAKIYCTILDCLAQHRTKDLMYDTMLSVKLYIISIH